MLFRELVLSLSTLHALDIAHRDIKPENVLVVAQPAEQRHGDATTTSSGGHFPPQLKLADLAFAHFDFGHSLCSECGS